MSELPPADRVILASRATLRYITGDSGPDRFIADIDPAIAELARVMIPKHYWARKPLHPPHITVVRREAAPDLARYDGEVIDFTYDPYVYCGGVYFWLRCWSERLVEIRLEQGLPGHTSLTRPPDGEHCFHITVANCKLP